MGYAFLLPSDARCHHNVTLPQCNETHEAGQERIGVRQGRLPLHYLESLRAAQRFFESMCLKVDSFRRSVGLRSDGDRYAICGATAFQVI